MLFSIPQVARRFARDSKKSVVNRPLLLPCLWCSPMPREVPTSASAPRMAPKGSFDTELDAFFSVPPPAQKPIIHEHDEHIEHSEESHVDEEDDSAEEEDESIEEDRGNEDETFDEGRIEEEDVASQEDGDWDEEKTAEMVLRGTLDKKRRKKPTLEDENDSERAQNKRTIFLGNVPVSALTSRAVRKELQRHIVHFSPYPSCTEIVSLRFRSVSFRVPTSDMSGVSPGSDVGNKRRERARRFRELKGIPEKEAPPPLTSEQKRKIAYINQDLNERADSVNAYVRIGDPSLVHKHKQASDPWEEKLTGPILTTLLARALDNTLFHERHLRADVVQCLDMHEIVEAELDKVILPDGTPLSHRSASAVDPRCTIFVGNLDFEAHEEEVRALFEKLMREERGSPPDVTSNAIRLDGTPLHTNPLPGEWVQSVRIVRDKATQLGKGFAYVKFVDPLCVDEMVALAEAEEAFVAAGRPQISLQKAANSAKKIGVQEGQEFRRRVKLHKRALRVSRCKATTGDERKRRRPLSDVPQTPNKRSIPESLARSRSSGAPTPNGSSPTQTGPNRAKAAYLATLSKEQRDLAKKSDPDRQARRLQKKNEKKQAQKLTSKVGQGRERVKLPQRGAAKKMTKAKGKNNVS